MKSIRVVKVCPGQYPEVIEIDDTLDALQNEVDGLIEFVAYKDNIDIMVNEEGKLRKLKPNRRFGDDVLCGNIVFMGCNGDGGSLSLTDEQCRMLVEEFWNPESFAEDFDHDDYINITMRFFGDDDNV